MPGGNFNPNPLEIDFTSRHFQMALFPLTQLLEKHPKKMMFNTDTASSNEDIHHNTFYENIIHVTEEGRVKHYVV